MTKTGGKPFWSILAITGLAGCIANERVEPVTPGTLAAASKTSSAALPQPMVGDSLRFDRGARMKAVAVDGDLVSWRRGKTTTMVKPRNPFLPYVEFENSKVVISANLDAPADALFPLAVGNTASFTEKRHVTYKKDARERAYERQWNCRVTGKETVEVKVGTFDTFVVRCENPASNALFRTARAYEWHYAPSLGQIVKERHERFRKAPRKKQLASFSTANPVARGPVFENVLQEVFETRPSATPVAWTDSGSGQAGKIEIRRTVKMADGTYCREAEISVETAGNPIGQNLRACRNQNGVWVPRLP